MRHYLDHASTSPPRPEVVEAMTGWLRRAGAGEVADPSRMHTEGLAARYELEAAREAVAGLVGARPREVVFTSGATEAIAAAVWGAAERPSGGERDSRPSGGERDSRPSGGERDSRPSGGERGSSRDHIVVPAVEHSAVRSAVEALVEAGTHRQTIVGVDATGRVRADEVLDAIEDATALVCVQWANHEVGTVQPVAEITAACRERGVLTLVDATAAAGHVPVDFRAVGADLLALSAHKLGGPTGTGALVVRRGLRLRPLLRGGDQERARRAGLEHAAGIIGFGAACTALAAGDRLVIEAAEARRLTDRLRALAASWDGVHVLGPAPAEERLPHLVCLGIEGVEPQPVLLGLDRAGVAVHSGSSCSSESLEPSPVLAAMGADAHRSLRISVGWSTTEADIDALADALPPVLERLRSLARELR